MSETMIDESISRTGLTRAAVRFAVVGSYTSFRAGTGDCSAWL